MAAHAQRVTRDRALTVEELMKFENAVRDSIANPPLHRYDNAAESQEALTVILGLASKPPIYDKYDRTENQLQNPPLTLKDLKSRRGPYYEEIKKRIPKAYIECDGWRWQSDYQFDAGLRAIGAQKARSAA